MPKVEEQRPRLRPRPKTPRRSVRISDRLWEQALNAAERREETVSEVVRRALEEYVR